MPKLKLDTFEMSAVPSDIGHKYASMLRAEDRKYFLLLLLFGCALFLFTLVL